MNYTPPEMMTVAAARALSNDDVCFVGIGLPSAACNLARLTHAPRINLIYESGTLQTRPDVLPLSIGDGELCETALTTVPVPEIFRYWLQGGRITWAFWAAPRWIGSAISTARSSAITPRPRCACRAAGAPPRSPPAAARSSSSCGRAAQFRQAAGFSDHARPRTHRPRTPRTGHPHQGPDAAGDRSVYHASGSGDQRDGGDQPAPGSHARAGRGTPVGRCGSPMPWRRRRRPPRTNWKCCAICTRAPRARTALQVGESNERNIPRPTARQPSRLSLRSVPVDATGARRGSR